MFVCIYICLPHYQTHIPHGFYNSNGPRDMTWYIETFCVDTHVHRHVCVLVFASIPIDMSTSISMDYPLKYKWYTIDIAMDISIDIAMDVSTDMTTNIRVMYASIDILIYRSIDLTTGPSMDMCTDIRMILVYPLVHRWIYSLNQWCIKGYIHWYVHASMNTSIDIFTEHPLTYKLGTANH